MFSLRSVASAISVLSLLVQTGVSAPAGANQIRSPLASRPWTIHSSPLKGFVRRDNGSNNSDNLHSVEEVCNSHDINDDDPESYEAAWDETTSGVFLDKWLLANDYHDWVSRMDSDYMGGQSTRDCSFADSCDPPDGCAKYVHKDAGPLYWILMAAPNAHESFTQLHEKIQDNTIYDSLEVDTMLEDLDAEPPTGDTGILGTIASSMVVAAGATAIAAPELSAMLTVFVGAFNLAANNKYDMIDPTAELKDQMAQVFQATQQQIEETCDTALKGDGDVSALPNQSGGWGTHIAGFFDAGKFLIGDVGDAVQGIVDDAHHNMQVTMINTILLAKGYFVYVDDDEDEDGCDGGGMIYTDDKCFSLWQFTDDDTTIADNNHEDLWPALEKYEYDLTTMYTESWKCALDGRGKPDTEDLPMDGSLPVCFYNLPVVEGTDYEHYGDQWIVVDGGVNTSGRDGADDE